MASHKSCIGLRNLSRMPRRSAVPGLLAIAVIIFATVQSAWAQKCNPASRANKKNEVPSFFCNVSVDIETKGCNVFVIEKYTFPHTTGKDAFRSILFEPKGGQKIRNLIIKRDGKVLPTESSLVNNYLLIVKLRTRKNSSPVLFEVSYEVVRGVYTIETSCLAGAGVLPTYNSLLWTPGRWDKSFKSLYVTFRSESATSNPLLFVLGGEWNVSSGVGTVTGVVRNVAENQTPFLSVFILEMSNEACTMDTTFCDIKDKFVELG